MTERLSLLEDNIVKLEQFKTGHSITDIEKDRNLEWALRYGLLESIQIMIDIACHLVGKKNLGNPETYNTCVELLEKHDYISSNLSKKLSGMIGLRNLLVHEYVDVDVSRLYELLDNLNDFREFVRAVSGSVKGEGPENEA